MPKKLGINQKAVDARARKDEKKAAEKARIEKEKEDAKWVDDDKHIQRKLERQQEREKKKLEELQKKQEKKLLLEQEMSELTKNKPSKQPPPKVSRAAIQQQQEREKKQRDAALAAKKKEKEIEDEPIEENINRIEVEGDVARNVDEAIAVLSISSKEPEVDRHPEKRVKAAFAAFETANLPRIKAENPTLRLSQLKEMLRKEWNKSPENPLVQAAMAGRI